MIYLFMKKIILHGVDLELSLVYLNNCHRKHRRNTNSFKCGFLSSAVSAETVQPENSLKISIFSMNFQSFVWKVD